MGHADFCMQEGGGPLSAHPLFHTRDVDEACARIARIFCPHELRLASTSDHFDARMCHISLGGVSVNRLRFGTSTHINAGRIEGFYVVHMPISGTADIAWGNEAVASHPRLASVVAPTRPLQMQWHQGCDQVVVRIDRELVDRYCAQHFGHDLPRPVEFELGMQIEACAMRSWRHLIGLLMCEADREGGMLISPLARPQLEQMVVGTLLFCQPHNYSEALRRPVREIAPYYVKRAEDYIHANGEKPLRMTELVRHCGVSTSALCAGFQKFRGTSPMAYVKSVRLERARAVLLGGGLSCGTVTAAAMRVGFSHLGHFTADYKRKFGETPSETLRRARS